MVVLSAGIRSLLCSQRSGPESASRGTRHLSLLKFPQALRAHLLATDYSTMLNALHAGPKQRGTERKQFNFIDGTRGDVYRCVLLAMRADPPSLSFPYEDILGRARRVCTGESPVGSSVAESLAQMARLARTVQKAPVIEWDEDVLDIVEPYFLFFLRCSPHLARLAKQSTAQADLPLGRP
jgi:hypothetical protein